jgi:subtilisin family serine protease
VSVFAPGVDVVTSTVGNDSAYAVLSGSYLAAAHVAGAAALYLGARDAESPRLGPSEVAGAIYASASINKLTIDDNTGNGSSPNRLLYSLVNQGDVPTTALAACGLNDDNCTTINGSIPFSSYEVQLLTPTCCCPIAA